MGKVIYKTVDPWGRVTIPRELREKLSIKNGDIVRIEKKSGSEELIVAKMDIIDVRDSDEKARDEYVIAAVKTMEPCKRIALATMILDSVGMKERR